MSPTKKEIIRSIHTDAEEHVTTSTSPQSSPVTRKLPIGIASSNGIDFLRLNILTTENETLVDCVVQLLTAHLQRIVARHVMADNDACVSNDVSVANQCCSSAHQRRRPSIVDEVTEVIAFPHASGRSTPDDETDQIAQALLEQNAHEWVQLPDNVMEQLHRLVSEIADMYNEENPFHNFEVRFSCWSFLSLEIFSFSGQALTFVVFSFSQCTTACHQRYIGRVQVSTPHGFRTGPRHQYADGRDPWHCLRPLDPICYFVGSLVS